MLNWAPVFKVSMLVADVSYLYGDVVVLVSLLSLTLVLVKGVGWWGYIVSLMVCLPRWCCSCFFVDRVADLAFCDDQRQVVGEG